MSATPDQVVMTPKRTPKRIRVADDNTLDLALRPKPSTTILEVQRKIALGKAKRELGMTQAEWLRLQQEIVEFLKQMDGKDRTNEDVAVAFLNDTGAKDRFFGMLAGGEDEGMLVNQAGFAWGINDDQIIPHVAAIVAACRPSAAAYDHSKVQVLAKKSVEEFENKDRTTATKSSKVQVLAKKSAEEFENEDRTTPIKSRKVHFLAESNAEGFENEDPTTPTKSSKVQVLAKRNAEEFENEDWTTPSKRTINPKVAAMLPADILKSCEVTAGQNEEDKSFFIDDDRIDDDRFDDDRVTVTKRILNPKVAAMLPADILESCGLTAGQNEGDNSFFINADRVTKGELNPKVAAMLSAEIPKSSGVTAAQSEEKKPLFVEDDQDRQRQWVNKTAIVSQEAAHQGTPRISSRVQTASAPRKRRALSRANRPTTLTSDMWHHKAKDLVDAGPTAPKRWLRVCLYAGGDRVLPGHKLLKVEDISSLADFNAQFFKAYHSQLKSTRWELQMDSIICYIVHHGIGGSGSDAEIKPHDDRAWIAALGKLQDVAEAGQAVLRGVVEVHLLDIGNVAVDLN